MRKLIVLLVVVGALLDVGVFAFQTYQYGQINANRAKSDCWSHVLDSAITHRQTPTEHAHLLVLAHQCVKL